MRNRRLVLIGLIVVVGGIAAALLLPSIIAFFTGDGQAAAEPTPTPTGMTSIVVSAQDIGRGQDITQDAVILQNWPVDAVPVGALNDLEDAYGLIARVDIPRLMPVLESMLAYPGEDITVVGEGSPASRMIPEGKVGYALPIARYTSVAWAIEPGDHVDVLISLLMIDLDEEFQSILPNMASCFSAPEGEECISGPYGRLEILPNGMLVNLTPNGPQYPRLTTQLTVQDAVVLHVGDWVESQPAAEGVGEIGVEGEGEEAVAPSGSGERSLTLAITRQEAGILEFARLSNARITLVLRAARDDSTASTTPVTLQYLLDRYSIEYPPALPYGLTPPIESLPVR